MKLNFTLIIAFLLFSYCSSPSKYANVKKEIPQFNKVDKAYCENDEEIGYISYVVHSEIKDNSWADAQSKWINSSSPDEQAKSLKLQNIRAIFAECATHLFGAIPTGSARDLKEMSLKTAKKDVDMSVPIQNAEKANSWLTKYIPEPDHTLELSLLMNPIDSLPCKSLKGAELTECAIANTLETTQVMIMIEIEKINNPDSKEHNETASMEDLSLICKNGFIIPDKDSSANKLKTALESGKQFSEFNSSFPELPNKNSAYKSSGRYKVMYTAVRNSAYYLEPESVRKWVVEREEAFNVILKKQFPEYASGKGVLEIEKEGAVLEQFLQASRHRKSIYYKFKYLFRAMEHIGFDIEKKIPEFSAIHRALKKNRPSTLEEAYADINKQLSEGLGNSEPVLKKYKDKLTQADFTSIVKRDEEAQMQAIRDYYQKRISDKNSIWPKVCKY